MSDQYNDYIIAHAARKHDLKVAQAQIQGVRNLHRPLMALFEPGEVCGECGTRYPCATIRVLGDE